MFRHRWVIGLVAVVFAAAGGGAYAATQSSTSPRQAFLNDVAKRLNVSPQRLTAALKAALIDRLNAAVKEGRLTQAQANAIEHRLQQGGRVPFLLGPPGMGLRPGGPRGFFGGPAQAGRVGPLAAAATYLGLSDTTLRNELQSGRSLAQIAKSKGKSTAGLERAMVASVKAKLDRAVASGIVTKSQEQQILSRLSSSLSALIQRPGNRFGPMLAGPAGPRMRLPSTPPSAYPEQPPSHPALPGI
jgi:AraC-like DNA-binding protein